MRIEPDGKTPTNYVHVTRKGKSTGEHIGGGFVFRSIVLMVWVYNGGV